MAPPLPKLRGDLDIMPSPVKEQPGILIRDPFRFSDATLIVPPLLARCLACFDGEQDERDLRALLTRLTGQTGVTRAAHHLVASLREAGFLDDGVFAEMRARRHRTFVGAPTRDPAHAGSGYPADSSRLAETLAEYLAHVDGAPHARGTAEPAQTGRAAGRVRGEGVRPGRARPPRKRGATAGGALAGVAAPHVSPEGGIPCYAAAYRALPADLGDRTFVILGTSHYGEPDRFGLTRKPFTTPFGVARTDGRLVDELARKADGAVHVEDYCHAVEHSVEFQVVFLQHLYGPDVSIVPVLCGAFMSGPSTGRPPESNEQVARFLDTLGDLSAREGRRLFFVLGVDMAHIGRRYGDGLRARAGEGALVEVEERDRTRIDRLAAADAEGFWELVHEHGEDDLKWCGSSPLYTFLRAVPGIRGELLRYQQWNIDDASVVSFGALAFRR
jgi:AmmeMemoRadiSam system protein B